MRLCIIVPIVGLTPDDLDARSRLLKQVARHDTEIDLWTVKNGPVSIESRYEEETAVAPVLELVKQAVARRYDAVGIWCGGDPGVHAARELATIPVVGPGEASLIFAHMLARRYSILALREDASAIFEDLVERTGLTGRLASIRFTGMTVRELGGDRMKTLERLEAVGGQAIAEDRAHALVLGCLGMAGLARPLEERLGVPVIDPAAALVGIAETLVHLGLSYSKITYPVPHSLRCR